MRLPRTRLEDWC